MPYPLKKLRRILTSFDVWEDPSRGKGSHTLFFRKVDDAVFSYPIPTHKKEINDSYVRGIRRKLKLDEENGVSDDDFFSRG